MLQTFLNIVHVFVCMVLVGVVLLQQGKGGGMGAAFGGATTQVFGGRGAGNLLTRATAVCAAIFMLTSVSLAYLSSSGDRALKARVAQEAGRKKDKGELKERSKDEPAPTDSAPAPATTDTTPTPPTTDTAPTPPTETAPAPEGTTAPAPAPKPAPAPEGTTAPAPAPKPAPAPEGTTAPAPAPAPEGTGAPAPTP